MTDSDTTPNPIVPLDRRWSRRALMIGVTGLVAAGAVHGRVAGQNATPVDSTASPIAASPVASPEASPVASPVASPMATPEMIGNLRVVRDQRPEFAGAPVRGGTISITRVGGDNLDFNPVAFTQDYQIPVSYLEPLVWIDGVTMEPLPWLATSWTSTRDGLAVTLNLRDDVTWHDGTPLTANDVAFSFEAYRDDFNSAAYTMFTNLKSVEVRDDQTVIARLSAPDGNWIRNACSQLIFQKAQYEATWLAAPVGSRTLSGYDWATTKPIGTGPWMVTEFRDSRVDFRANRAYWGDSPWATEMRTDYLSDAAAQRTAWHEGRTDIIWPVAYADVESISDRAGTLFAAESARVMLAAFNFNNPGRPDPTLLASTDVRNALAMGINRSRYARDVFGTFCRPDLVSTIVQPDLVL
ncbi:MAG TPA: ABC transporter substrate-binding protein, partial [Thermomicrobiales bacterium]|nr:ABC transporter substrate-binding protein [Thermomicrobiales bacterium]